MRRHLFSWIGVAAVTVAAAWWLLTWDRLDAPQGQRPVRQPDSAAMAEQSRDRDSPNAMATLGRVRKDERDQPAPSRRPTDLVEGICGPQAYRRLQELAARTDLSQAECQALHGFLRAKTSDEKLERMASIKNTVMTVLAQQRNLPAPWDRLLQDIHQDPDQHPTIRDYALQHLFAHYETVVDKGGREVWDPARREELLGLFWRALDQTQKGIAGTSLLGLLYLSEREPAVDQERVKARALGFLQDTRASDLVRASAFQVCALLDCEPALRFAQPAADGPGNLALRASAVAAVGALGTARELPFLDELAADANPGIQRAAIEARRRLVERLENKRL